jgi:hypothetical protein
MHPLEAASRNIFRTKLPDAGEAVTLSFYVRESLLFSAGRGGTWANADGKPIASGWQHVACVYGAKEVRIYQDGKLTGSAEVVAPLSLAGQPLWFGDCGLAVNAFRGRLNEIRISRGERYTADFQPERQLAAEKETLALYHLGEGAGNQAQDASGKGRHGTIARATWVSALTGKPLAP